MLGLSSLTNSSIGKALLYLTLPWLKFHYSTNAYGEIASAKDYFGNGLIFLLKI